MIRNTGLVAAVLILGMALGAGGWLLGARPSVAQDDTGVVSAVATHWTTEYEPDPFDDNMLRRSNVRVSRIAVVYSDGHTELREVGN